MNELNALLDRVAYAEATTDQVMSCRRPSAALTPRCVATACCQREGSPSCTTPSREDENVPNQERPDPEQLAAAVERLLAAVPEDEASTGDRMLRARLEGYAAGLRAAVCVSGETHRVGCAVTLPGRGRST